MGAPCDAAFTIRCGCLPLFRSMLPNSTLLYRPAIIELVFELFAQRMPLSQRGYKMGDFGKLLEEQIPRLRRYARALTRNAPIADDLVQDCLTRAVLNQIEIGRA